MITTSGVQLLGDRDVTVTSASLVEAEGLELIGHEFGPFASDFAVNGSDYGRHGPLQAPTTVLQAGESYAVKIGLAAAPGGGTAAAVEIEYHVDGSRETRTTQTRVAMAVAGAGESCAAAH